MTRALFAAVSAALVAACATPEGTLQRINVAALDRQGQPVTGLHSADFQLQEDGKARNIAFFRFTGDQPLQAKRPEEGPPPGEYSNRAGAVPHLTVLLVDLLSDRMLSGSMIGDDLTKALKSLESSDGLYLYFLTTGGELYPIHPLPIPGADIPPAAEPWTRNITPMLQTALKTLVGIKPVDDRDTKVRFDLTMHAMKDLGSQMELVAGRKTLIWVTHGLPMNGPSISEHGLVDFTIPLRVVCELLERVQIVVYAVEQSTRGVAAAIGTESAMTLDEISSLTGGRKFGSGQVDDAIRQAAADSRGNYELAYYSPAWNPDGKHHKLRVTCSQKDVRVQTVQGFYGLLTPGKPGDAQRLAFETTIRNPFDATEIGVRTNVSPDPDAAPKTRFDIHIDPADLMLRQVQDHRAGKVLLMFAQYKAEGLEQPGAPLSFDISLTQQQYETALHGGLSLRQSIAVGAGVRKVRVIVVDEELGSVGSVTVPTDR